MQSFKDRGDRNKKCCGHDARSYGVDGPAASSARENEPALEVGLEAEISHPEGFFPRCWDVSDDGDGACSLLKAFAVSAAVALLRTAVKDEVWDGFYPLSSHLWPRRLTYRRRGGVL